MQLFKNISSLSDEQLIDNYKSKNDHKSFGELYNRYNHLVYGTCMKYLKDTEGAGDMLSFIFEKLLKELKNRKITCFRSWLYRLSVNECLMKLRKVRKEVYLNSAIELRDNDSTNIEAIELKEEKLIELEAAIKELKPNQKLCIELFYLKQMSYQKIENETGIELKKVKSYIQNGKRNLKLILEKRVIFKQESHGY